jgi:hypothetical protein
MVDSEENVPASEALFAPTGETRSFVRTREALRMHFRQRILTAHTSVADDLLGLRAAVPDQVPSL